MDIKACLKEAVQRGASDFHIVVGIPPTLRVDGELVMMAHKPVSQEEAAEAIHGILGQEQRQAFESQWESNFALSVPELARFRL